MVRRTHATTMILISLLLAVASVSDSVADELVADRFRGVHGFAEMSWDTLMAGVWFERSQNFSLRFGGGAVTDWGTSITAGESRHPIALPVVTTEYLHRDVRRNSMVFSGVGLMTVLAPEGYSLQRWFTIPGDALSASLAGGLSVGELYRINDQLGWYYRLAVYGTWGNLDEPPDAGLLFYLHAYIGVTYMFHRFVIADDWDR